MTATTHIVSLEDEETGPEGEHAAYAPSITLPESGDAMEWLEYEAPPPPRWQRWIAPVLFAGALAGWTGLNVAANLSQAPTPAHWLAWIGAWSPPVAVLGILWLVLRPDRPVQANPAEQFSETAHQMQADSALLESRLTAVNAELSIAREFLAAQSRELESLGRLATERLSQNARELADLIQTNGADLATIGTVSSAALDNMERLRGQLPMLTSAARDVANTIGTAGRLASDSVSELTHGMDRLDSLGAAGEARIAALRDTLAEAGLRGQDLSAHVSAANESLAASIGQIGLFHNSVEVQAQAHAALLEGMRTALAALDEATTALGQKAANDLSNALASLHEAALAAGLAISEAGGHALADVATRLGSESIPAIERAIRNEAAALTGQLEQAAAHAAGVAREAGSQIADQVGRVEDLVAALEARVAEARAQAEAQTDNGFGRRAALITDALNSSAIDIAKALDADIADPAWARYLKGDRGIFTRAAVRLLDGGESKAVARLYRDDDAFRDHVSHYIHDFEGMLRQILSTRDGEALGVTLLSSDMGKLYVALAQAIERLRS